MKAYQRIGPHNIDILSIIFGTLLGDAHAERRSYITRKGVTKGGTRISFQQQNNNVEYLIFLWKRLSCAGYTSLSKPRLTQIIGPKGKSRYSCRFHTWTFSNFNWIHDMFYETCTEKKILKVKRVPPYEDLFQYLTPLALACWIMDKGVKVQKSLKLCTNSFSVADISLLRLVLKNKYNLETSMHKAGIEGHHVLYIKKASMPLLRRVIEPYFVRSMMYKIM